VIAAVTRCDLLQTVRLDIDGGAGEGRIPALRHLVNTMIKQLGVFTTKVTRVAREVGTEGCPRVPIGCQLPLIPNPRNSDSLGIPESAEF
jgi:hypothetical protein